MVLTPCSVIMLFMLSYESDCRQRTLLMNGVSWLIAIIIIDRYMVRKQSQLKSCPLLFAFMLCVRTWDVWVAAGGVTEKIVSKSLLRYKSRKVFEPVACLWDAVLVGSNGFIKTVSIKMKPTAKNQRMCCLPTEYMFRILSRQPQLLFK